MYLRSVTETLIPDISYMVYGESNFKTKSLIRDRLNSAVRRENIVSKQLNLKLFNKPPSILNVLLEHPIRLSRHPREWLSWFGESVGCSFYLFPWEAQEGVLFIDSELNDWFYDLGLVFDQCVVSSYGGTRYKLFKDYNNVWHGFDRIVEEFSLSGGERIGFCHGHGNTVLFEVLKRNSPIKKFQEIIEQIISTTSPREIAGQLYTLGIRRLNGEIRERTYKGLIELGLSHEICVQIFNELERMTHYSVSAVTIPLTPIKLDIKDSKTERGDRWLSYPTEDLLTELSDRFKQLKVENKKLRNKCNELLIENENISNEVIELKEKLKTQSFEVRRNTSNDSLLKSTELQSKEQLRRFAELYKRNGPIVVYLATVLSMAGGVGLAIEELEEIAYLHFSLKRSDLDSILDSFPFFVKNDGTCYLVTELHKVTILASLNESDTLAPQTYGERSEEEQKSQQNPVVIEPQKDAKSDFDPITASTDDIFDKIWEANRFDLSVFSDCINGLMISRRYSTIVELANLMQDALLNDGENSEKFRLSLLIIAFSYLYLDDIKNAEIYWDYYAEASESSGESNIENFLFALKLSFVLELDEELFDVIDDSIMLDKLKTEKLDAEAYSLVYSILNNENNGTGLLRRLEQLLCKYDELLENSSLKFIDLHERFIEAIRLTVNFDE